MHPRVDGLKPLPALALAGRDVYQREGCVDCHTQTVRPLPSEVTRYDGNARRSRRAILHGRRVRLRSPVPVGLEAHRAGPGLRGLDQAAKAWHVAALRDPAGGGPAVEHARPTPSWASARRRRAGLQAHMRALRAVGVPYTDEEIAAVPAAVEGKTELDGLVAYVALAGQGGGPGSAGRRWSRARSIWQPGGWGHAAAINKGKELFGRQLRRLPWRRRPGHAGRGPQPGGRRVPRRDRRHSRCRILPS